MNYEIIINYEYFDELFGERWEEIGDDAEEDTLIQFEDLLNSYINEYDENFDYENLALELTDNSDYRISFDSNEGINLQEFKTYFSEYIGEFNDEKIRINHFDLPTEETK